MIDCVHCHRLGDPIDSLPQKGVLGEEIKAKVCSPCWEEWKKESVKLINEHRLNLSELSARNFLSTQMKIYLNLTPPLPNASITISPS